MGGLPPHFHFRSLVKHPPLHQLYTLKLLLIAATKFSYFNGSIKIAKFSMCNHYFLNKIYIEKVTVYLIDKPFIMLITGNTFIQPP